MNEIQVSFRSGDLTLEGLIANPGGSAPAAVVCHPHPMYGGSMHHNVVEAILVAMWKAGYELGEVARIVAGALPLAMTDARIPDGASKPVLLVSGDHDSYSPVA